MLFRTTNHDHPRVCGRNRKTFFFFVGEEAEHRRTLPEDRKMVQKSAQHEIMLNRTVNITPARSIRERQPVSLY